VVRSSPQKGLAGRRKRSGVLLHACKKGGSLRGREKLLKGISTVSVDRGKGRG